MHFHKHHLLPDIGEKTTILERKTASIIGLSSVGSVVAEILTRAGIGLRLIDKGRVDEEDLLTNALYTPEEVSRFKAKEAKRLLERICPHAKIKTFHEELNDKNAFLIDADVVVDCSNNPHTLELVQKRCKTAKLPLITVCYAGASFILLCSKGGYPLNKFLSHTQKIGTVKEKGLFAPLSPIAGGMATAEALKMLLGKTGNKKPYRYDVLSGVKKEFSL